MAEGRPKKDLTLLARVGYVARGFVYLIVGGFAVLAALGRGGATMDTRGALGTILTQPAGYALLAITAFGLVCFSIWRAAQALLNADDLGDSWKERMRRVGFGVGGLVNAGLAVSAVSLLVGAARASSGDQGARDWTAWLLSMPFGRWLVAIVGVTVALVGLAVARRAWKADFEDPLDIDEDVRRWARPMGQAGFFARAVVFLIVGGFLAVAAWHANPQEAKGLSGALRTLQEQPYGWVLLGATAAGLFLFGAFQFVVARYRRIDVPHPLPGADRARVA